MNMPGAIPIAPRVQIALAAGLFSTGGLAIKACEMTAWQVACFRAAVAAAALALLTPAARRGWSARTLVVALPFSATIILFTLSNRATTAANAIFLQDTAPLYVLLLAPWLLGERVERRDLWFIGAVAAGFLLLVLGATPAARTAPNPALGNLLATVAGLTWALTLMGLRWLAVAGGERGNAALSGALAGNVVAAVVAAPFAFPVAGATATDWLLIGYLGVFQIALSYVLISAAMPRLPAFEVALLLLLEPVLTPLWAWLVLGERTGAPAIAGGACIVGATALRVWQQRMMRSKA
ncbi:MAG: DMT family transporter [Gammaproteobacteria bacterium]|nr:DMT family transporter [Gammaproteobacteria bacterium]